MKTCIQNIFAWCLAALLLSACASGAQPSSQSEADDTTDSQSTPAAQSAPVSELERTDDEVMYRVFAAEYLGSEGDLEGAVGEYLEAALRSDDPQIARRATQVAYAAEAWQQASMAADRWSLLQPDSVPAHESAAIAMFLVGDYLGGEYQLSRILDLMEDTTEAWLLVANVLAQAAGPEQADGMLEQLLTTRQTVDDATSLFVRSHLSARLQDLKRAFEMARQAVELKPEKAEYLTWAGRLALNLNLTETGLEYVRRAWRTAPDDHDLSLGFADLLARNGHEEEARTVMSEMPQSPDVMLSRILFELAAKKRTAAEKLYAQFRQMDFPDSVDQTFYKAQAAEALGFIQQAIELYAAVEDEELALAGAIRIAELRALDGDMATARSELAELRKLPNQAVVEASWLAESRILRETGAKEESFQVLGRALEDLPGSIALLYSHALLAAELGWVDVAERDLRLVIAAQPENAAALNALGYTLADQTERYEEAEALIRQAFILQPEEPSIIDSMGWVAFRLGHYEQSVRFLQKAWQLDRNPEIAAHLGEVLWVLGKKEAALAIWGEGFDIDSSNPVLNETLARLGIDL